MIVTLTGENRFLLQAELQKLIAEFVAKYTDMGLERIDAGAINPEDLRSALQSLPFLVERRMVIVSEIAANKQLGEKITDVIKAIPDSTDVLFVEPKFDKRSVLYKTLKKDTDLREFNELDASALARWLARQAKEQGGTLSQSDATYLVNRLGPNQLLLSKEIEKLVTYNQNVTRETIDLLTEPLPQSSIFELLEAAFAGNKKRTHNLYRDQRAQRVEPQAILAMIAWQLHVLAVVKAGGNLSPDEIAKQAKISPFVVRKSVSIARAIPLVRLKELVHDTLILDVRLKSESIDADDALQHLLLTIGN